MATGPADDDGDWGEKFARCVRVFDREARRVDKLSAQLRETDTRTADISQNLDTLAETVRDLAAMVSAHAASARPTSWFAHTDPDQAAHTLEQLTQWVGGVFARYDSAKLTDCWTHHPGVVEELLWLQQMHNMAYGEHGTWKAAADWHHIYRPAATARIQAALKNCDATTHARDDFKLPGLGSTPTASELATAATEHVLQNIQLQPDA